MTTSDNITSALNQEAHRAAGRTAQLFKDGWRPLYLWSPPAKPGDEVQSFLNQIWVLRQ